MCVVEPEGEANKSFDSRFASLRPANRSLRTFDVMKGSP
jgi:hypothetical protein